MVRLTRKIWAIKYCKSFDAYNLNIFKLHKVLAAKFLQMRIYVKNNWHLRFYHDIPFIFIWETILFSIKIVQYTQVYLHQITKARLIQNSKCLVMQTLVNCIRERRVTSNARLCLKITFCHCICVTNCRRAFAHGCVHGLYFEMFCCTNGLKAGVGDFLIHPAEFVKQPSAPGRKA